MNTLFISDLHLEDDKPGLTRFFFSFLDHIAINSNRLFILGDFFEAWVGDDEQTELHINVADKLSALANQGVDILIMHGNRDFLMGPDYVKQCQAKLIEEPFFLTVGEKRVLLMHGDALCTDDVQYMKFRNIARNPDWQRQILSMPLKNRKQMAQQLRQASSSGNQAKNIEIMDVAEPTVRSTIEQYQVDVLLHGHTHRPAEHTVDLTPLTSLKPFAKQLPRQARRLVLGDWGHQTWYASASEQSLQLIRLEASEFSDSW